MGKKALTHFIFCAFALFSRPGPVFSQSAAEAPPSTQVKSSIPPEQTPEILMEDRDELPDTIGKLRLDLTDCVRMAVRNNPEIRGAEYDVEDSRYKLKEAQPRGIPTLTYEVEAAPAPKDASRAVESFFEGDVTLLGRMKVHLVAPVTSFGKIRTAQSLARSGIEGSLEKKNQKSSEVVLKVKQLYYGILLARELRGLFEKADREIGKEVEKREAETSTVDPIELAKLKLTRFEVLKRMGEAARKEEVALQGLRIQMGVDRGYPFEIIDRRLKPVQFELKDLAYYLEEGKRYRPESRLLDIALKAKEDEYRLEKKKLFPDLGVGAFFEMGRTVDEIQGLEADNDFNDPFNFTRAGVGVRLRGEFNYRQAMSRIRQKQAQYYKMSITKDHAEEGLDLDLEDSYLSARQTKIDLENAEKAQRLARQLVFLTKSNYDVGVGEKKDYGESLQAYLLMRGRYYEAVFQYNVAVAALLSKVGYQFQP